MTRGALSAYAAAHPIAFTDSRRHAPVRTSSFLGAQPPAPAPPRPAIIDSREVGVRGVAAYLRAIDAPRFGCRRGSCPGRAPDHGALCPRHLAEESLHG